MWERESDKWLKIGLGLYTNVKVMGYRISGCGLIINSLAISASCTSKKQPFCAGDREQGSG